MTSVPPSNSDNISNPDNLHSAEVIICNNKGLHARAAAQFVKCAGSFNAIVHVTRSGETVGGTSIMGLMMLAAAKGSQIFIQAQGADAQQALEALVALVEAKFHETE